MKKHKDKEKLTVYKCMNYKMAEKLFSKFEELDLDNLDKDYFFRLYEKGGKDICFSIRFGTWCVGGLCDDLFERTIVELDTNEVKVITPNGKTTVTTVEKYFNRDWRSNYKLCECKENYSILEKGKRYFLDMDSIWKNDKRESYVAVYYTTYKFVGTFKMSYFILVNQEP